MSDDIPTIGTYRRVGLHDHQDADRLAVVRADIDAVYSARNSIEQLIELVQRRSMAPESRLLARAFILAYVGEQKDKRRKAPNIDEGWLNAVTGGLGTISGRSTTHFDAKFAPRPRPGSKDLPVRRPYPLPPYRPIRNFSES